MQVKHDLQNACILAVDDEEQNLLLFEQILQHAGYRNIVLNNDPRETLILYERHLPDIVLLDINMPFLNGFELLELLKSQVGDDLAPVLVMTAQTQKDYCEKALELGASDFVFKPFSIREVSARVNNLVEISLFRKQMKQQHQTLEQEVEHRTEQLSRMHEELRQSRFQIVQRLSQAAGYRDNDTGYHILRMSKVSCLLAEKTGMTAEECDLILHASPMHDIGKIGIADSILLRKEKLDSQSWEIMKTHTSIGANLLHGDDSDLISMAREIALTHHEKWDGSGYPNGLEAEQIPLVGRICAIADVFDALISERPYKHAWPVDEAITYINNKSGQHFDPELVDHFNSSLPEIQVILETYTDPI
jgi:putative two-component system response regulator